MNYIEYKTTLDLFLDAMGGKWKILIVYKIRNKAKRPNELKKELQGISNRVLTNELKELVEDGIVNRKLYPEVPPKVEYSLTDYGKTVIPILDKLCEWGKNHLEKLLEKNGDRIKVSNDIKLKNDKKIIVKRSIRINEKEK